MAKKSFSTKKSLRNLFSKSEANLKESVEKDDSSKGTLKLIKWKTMKSDSLQESLKAPRTESGTLGAGTLGDSETQDDERGAKRKTSFFGTVFRSKKVQHSYSESDLRKSKGFAVSLSWKKKKKSDLPQGLSSSSEAPVLKDRISEQEEFDIQEETEQNQVGLKTAVPTPEPSCTSDQSQSQNILSDMSKLNEEDAGFVPSNLDSTSIPYIDSSLSESDADQTPPDSPSEDKSVLYSNPESKITDSFRPPLNMETAASTVTCIVHKSNIDLNPIGVSFRDDQPFSDFETPESGISADVEVNTFTTDITPNNDEIIFQKESHLERKESKDVTSAILSIHESSIPSIPQSSIPSTPQSFDSSTPPQYPLYHP